MTALPRPVGAVVPGTASQGTSLPGTSRLGATPDGSGACSFVVWGPRWDLVRVRTYGPGPADDGWHEESLASAGGGYHVGMIDSCPAGTRYRLVLADGTEVADPCARFQPDGVHGPSEVFDPSSHRWADGRFVPPPLDRYVVYELHVGTFTDVGTLDGAVEHLDDLAELGITAVELLPVAQFPGRWNWGYDGVFPFAVQNTYGGPAALQRFVDACHQRGMAVVLDVVYNHLGPEGSVLDVLGPYFTDRYRTPWGPAVNVDGPDSDEVRRFFVENALGWLRDFHVDALRLDAVHSIVDTTATPFLADLSMAVDALGGERGRRFYLIAESADNNPRLVAPLEANGLGMDAQWNDDFHHSLHAVVTGERTGYYEDFGRLDQLARTMSEGFYFQGEYSIDRRRRHGGPSASIDPARLVIFAQNHDHIGNRPAGDRLASLVSSERLRLVAAVLLLSPGVPLLFMGEEYGETAPFPFFVDHRDPVLCEAVRTGRARELAALGVDGAVLDPTDETTRHLAVLDRTAPRTEQQQGLRQLHAGLIRFRTEHPTFAHARRSDSVAHAVGNLLILVRSFGSERTVSLFNFDRSRITATLPDPPSNRPGGWRRLLGSQDAELGGSGGTQQSSGGDGIVGLEAFGFAVYEWVSAEHQTSGSAPPSRGEI